MLSRHTHYKNGQVVKKSRMRFVSLAISLVLIGAGVYLLLILRAPNVEPLSQQQQQAFIPEEIGDSRIIIPKISVNAELKSGDVSALQSGAWHRFPERGNPVDGGNFIISAHRFVSARTPAQTKELSYFYNIDKLAVGDEILADWRHQRYKYRISEIKTVAPTQVDIEAESSDAKMTLYTCTLKGDKDGRVVIIAEPVSS